ncbi:MotA/TolQ/ExbB proton channel family protein [Thalassoglobus sp. JC818]|uniref:MotA/TolQ/ExbB proton channel family protein n=1 Tax=Thalassoglobus sp. JC818 TaxID=3232136 RepID=UPI00345B2715
MEKVSFLNNWTRSGGLGLSKTKHSTLCLVIALAFTGSFFANSAHAQEVELTPVPASDIDSATASQNAIEQSDVAQGDTAAPSRGLPTNILEIFLSLRYWIIPFALATLIAVWFTTERVVVLRRGRVIPKPFVLRFLKLLDEGELDREEALQICEENGSPVATVFAHGVRKWGKPSVEVEQAIIDGGERQVSALRKHLRVINGVATVTPLIGLLGTVWGMLESFNQIAVSGAMGNTNQLASGIALALVTTAAGLIVAIPSLISYMYLSGRVDSIVMQMDDLAQRVVHNISAEGIAEKEARLRMVAGSKGGTKKSAG